MKSKVRLSSASRRITLTLSSMLLAFTTYAAATDEMPMFYTLAGIVLILMITSLIYAPRVIEIEKDKILVKSYLKTHKIMMRNVAGVETFTPTMGTVRVFGCGGFLGYWGIFKEGDVGRYVAYYGKSSDCFIVRMKNGDKYVLGCENPKAMVSFINSVLQ